MDPTIDPCIELLRRQHRKDSDLEPSLDLVALDTRLLLVLLELLVLLLQVLMLLFIGKQSVLSLRQKGCHVFRVHHLHTTFMLLLGRVQ